MTKQELSYWLFDSVGDYTILPGHIMTRWPVLP